MTNLVSFKLDIAYAGTIVSEIGTFRPERLVHSTVINGTLVTLTANTELTNLTVSMSTNEEKEDTINGKIYLPFPLLDIIQEPYQIPGLFKLSLKNQYRRPTIAESPKADSKAESPKAEAPKATKSESAKDESVKIKSIYKKDNNDFITVSSHKTALLKNLFTDKSVEKVNLPKILADYISSEELFNKNIGDFKCELYMDTPHKSCLALIRKKPKITLCVGCRGKISANPQYNCAYEGCKFKVFIRYDGEKQNKYCNIHSTNKAI